MTNKKKRTTYPDGSAIPRHLQQQPIDKETLTGDKRITASLTDELKMKIDTRRKKLNREPLKFNKYSTGGTVSGMRRFYKGGKV